MIDNQPWLDRIKKLTSRFELPNGMKEKNGFFYKGNRLYIPGYQDIKTTILQENHDGNAGHFGFKKTLTKVARHYYWERMADDVKRFVQTCDTCQRNKGTTQKPFSMLNPIAPPTDKFETYSLDFIGPLPKTSHGYDGLLVIVDTFTKAVVLTPIEFTYGAKEVADVVFSKIISRFGVPRKIISDRDPRFTGAFWKRIFKLVGTKIALSTAFHPQSDGQTERTNRTLETILRTQINGTQTNWDDLLPMAEFAINSTPNESTKFSPFQLMYGKIPQMPVDLVDRDSVTPAAEEFISAMAGAVKEARENILKAQQGQKTQADKHRRDHQFKIGDRVRLSSKNLSLATGTRKLSPRWVGPYEILEKFGDNTFKLDLRGNFPVHPNFHASLLQPWYDNDDTRFPDRKQPTPPPITIKDHEEFEVEKILKMRKRGKSTQYLVRWKGYHPEDDTWEPEANLRHAPDLIAEFKNQRSGKILQISIKELIKPACDSSCAPTFVSSCAPPDDTDYAKISGRNSFKKGDSYHEIPITSETENHPENPNPQAHPKSNMHALQDTVYIQQLQELAKAMNERGQQVKMFAIQDFIEVIVEGNEYNYAYHDKDATGSIMYFRSGLHEMPAMHFPCCDCSNCIKVRNAPIIKPREPTPAATHLSYTSKYRDPTPPRPSPYQKFKGKSPMWTHKEQSPRYSPRPPSQLWTPSPPPVETNEVHTSTEEMWENRKDWEETNKPVDQTRELVPSFPLQGPRSAESLNEEIYLRIKGITKFDVRRLQILPNMPKYSSQRKARAASKANSQLIRAQQLLEEAYNGHITFASAHRRWVLFLGECEHGVKYRHASTECGGCDDIERNLNSSYEKAWDVKEEQV